VPRAPADEPGRDGEAAPLPSALASSGDAAPSSSGDEGLPRAAAAALAVVPGIVLGGSGHFALGQRQTAYRLFALEGIGLGLIAAGTLPLIATGASRYLTAPLALAAVTGVAIGTTGWFADVYGAAVAPEWRGRSERRRPQLEVELGYRYVYDPAFSYRSFLVNGLEVGLGGLRLRPSGWFALDDRNERLSLTVAYRYVGPRAWPAPAARDGSFLELATGLTHHRYGTEGFRLWAVDVAAGGRLDLQRYDALLAGMFSELSVGLGLDRIDVDAAPAGLGTDDALVLLARFGFGVYLGGPAPPCGELSLFYDHRHDDLVAGTNGPLVGIPGHAGLSGLAYLSDTIGLAAEVQVGAAVMTGLSLRVRQGAVP
jgi:hypothetical protein